MAKNKRITKARASFDNATMFSLVEAVKLVKQNAVAKFDESVEIAVNTGLDTRHSDQQVRSTVNLPHGTGKTLRVAVFARGAKAEEAQKAGADIIGAEDLVEKIQGGFLEFDRCVATPDMMALVGRIGKILGPKNLMPNPKLGTVTNNISEAVRDSKGGQVQFRTDKSGIVHALVGKSSFAEDALVDNVRAFIGAINTAKPAGSKGTYLKKISISSTMGPGVKLDLTKITA